MFPSKRTIIFSLILSLFVPANEVSGEEISSSEGKQFPSANVMFRKGISKLELDYKDNQSALDSITSSVYRIMVDDFENLKAIEITTAASPEGIYELNIKLADERAQSIKAYLLEKLPLKSNYYWIRPLGEDWDGLYRLVNETNNQWRDKILGAILSSNVITIPTKESSDACIAGLKAIDEGKAWRWLYSDIFPRLRNGVGIIRCVFRREGEGENGSPDKLLAGNGEHHGEMSGSGTAEDDSSGVVASAGAIGAANPTRVDSVSTGMARRRRSMADDAEALRLAEAGNVKRFRNDTLFRTPVIAIRSNLLVPLMNIGIEIPIGNRWSIEADWYSPWAYRNWMNTKYPKNENCFQAQMAYLCGRVWLGKMHSNTDGNTLYRLRGHSIGFGAGVFRYDIGFNNEGQQSNGIAIGVDYQYALPLGKGGVQLEFSCGICGCYRYFRVYNVETENTSGGETVRTGILFSDNLGKTEYLAAPFKASVNLVVPIFSRK